MVRNGTGSEVKQPRGGDAIKRHVTHIHVEWGSADINNTGFESALAAELTNIPNEYE